MGTLQDHGFHLEAAALQVSRRRTKRRSTLQSATRAGPRGGFLLPGNPPWPDHVPPPRVKKKKKKILAQIAPDS